MLFRSGALFVDMTNDDHRYAAALGKVQEQVGALLNLANGAKMCIRDSL